MGSKAYPKPLQSKLQELLDRRRTNSTLRNLTLPLLNQTDFSSNDFLSLSTSPQLKLAYLQELQRIDLPLGSGGSRLLDGNSTYAEQLEQEIASFHGAAAGLLFNSGFDANAGFFASVPQPGDVIVYDELVHASVHDGMRLSRAEKTIAFEHNSVSALEKTLLGLLSEEDGVRSESVNIFVALESIYSMDGDVCPLKEMVEIVEEVLGHERGYIIVDEAHSTGVLGPKGRGLVCELGLEKRVFARLHTFGKAVAANGGKAASSFRSSTYTKQIHSNHSRLRHLASLPHQLRPSTHLHNIPVLSVAGAYPLFVPNTSVWAECETTSPSTTSHPASLC
jgi:8-amino-7-oxononanoate synthase